jgi:hypothetical protein
MIHDIALSAACWQWSVAISVVGSGPRLGTSKVLADGLEVALGDGEPAAGLADPDRVLLAKGLVAERAYRLAIALEPAAPAAPADDHGSRELFC